MKRKFHSQPSDASVSHSTEVAARDVVFGDLVSTRLHALASISSAVTTMRMRRKFNLSLLEWRAIGHLGSTGPHSLKELAQRCGLDKSYASRTVTSLVSKGTIVSERSEDDGRGVVLSLTPIGHELYEKGMQDALQRNEYLLATLNQEDRDKLISTLDILACQAKMMLKEERTVTHTAADHSATPR